MPPLVQDIPYIMAGWYNLSSLDGSRKVATLADVCTLILNEETQDGQLRDVIFTQITKERLEESIAIVQDLAHLYDDKFHDELIGQP